MNNKRKKMEKKDDGLDMVVHVCTESQHLGGGGRRIMSSRLAWAT
jgi:hypothetical protein